MIDKKIIMGILIGLSLGITPLAFSYQYYTKASDLTAVDLRDVIRDALSECTVKEDTIFSKYEINC